MLVLNKTETSEFNLIFFSEKTADIIRNELQKRKKKNPLFSNNSFAKYLGISPTYLSLVLKGQRPITRKLAKKVESNLKFSAEEKKYFNLLLELEHAESEDIKAEIIKKLELFRSQNQIDEIGINSFRVISDWYFSAILESANLTSISTTLENIAEKLRLPKNKVLSAINILVELKFLKKK